MSLLEYDHSHVWRSALGDQGKGITPEDWKGASALVEGAHSWLSHEKEKEAQYFRWLPEHRPGLASIQEAGRHARENFKNLVLVGIGGSALGPRALFRGLCHRYHNEVTDGLRFYLLENSDPASTWQLLEMLDPKETLFNVVSKSGGTAETVANFLALQKYLGIPKDHLLFTTDPKDGLLRKAAQEHSIRCLDLHPKVGGRFSVLTPVGLFPVAALGLDPEALLEGARQMDAACSDPDPEDNPAYAYALIHFLMDRLHEMRMQVLMPYSDRLEPLAEWWAQLWAESLGKEKDLRGGETSIGPNPIRALGAIDQHSQMQLYNEGPNERLVTFLEVKDHGFDPALEAGLSTEGAQGLLVGHSIGELLNAERLASAHVLAQRGRPNETLRIQKVDEMSFGALFQFWEIATACAGHLYQVNPFDQPGVEGGKIAAKALLGDSSHAHLKAEILAGRGDVRKVVVPRSGAS